MATFLATESSKPNDDENHSCTYFVSGDHLVHQAIFCCHTCSDQGKESTVSNICCCGGCAEVCHKGHEVEYLANNLAYCDCGQSGCQLYQSTKERHQTSLQVGEEYLYGGEVPLSIADRPFETHRFSDIGKEMLEFASNQCLEIVSQSKETFWVGCDWQYSSAENQTNRMSCRVQLEELALYIFNYHLQLLQSRSPIDFKFNRSLSGAEWWIQVKDLVNPDINSSSINLHYDKDEDLAENFDVGIFPSISTVTYLTEQTINNSQPTIIFPTTANDPVGTQIRECYISYPRFGKHLSFDGRLLHGAPSDAQLRDWRGVNEVANDLLPGKRITFLVNIWLNHHPANVQPLPQNIVDVLTPAPSIIPHVILLADSTSEIVTQTIIANDETTFPESCVEDFYVADSEGQNMQKLHLPFVSKEMISQDENDDDADTSELLVEMYLPPYQNCFSSRNFSDIPHCFHLRYHSFPAQIISSDGDDDEWEDAEDEELENV